MSNKEKHGLHKKYSPSNYTFGTDAGSQKTAFSEVGIVAPNATIAAGVAYGSKFEGFAFPRAIVSRMCMYNADFNLSAAYDAGNPALSTYISNEYFTQAATSNGDAASNTSAPR
jgi:hypothetical protein